MYSSLSDEMARGWDCFNNRNGARGGGGGVGAHSIDIGEGAFHLRWWGKQSLHTMLKKRKPYSFFRLPCLALAFLNSESLRYS